MREGSLFQAFRLRSIVPERSLGIFGWGCAPGTLESLAYTRASVVQVNFATLQIKLPKSPLSQRSCFPETTEVTSIVQPKQNRFDFFYIFEWQFPVFLVQSKIFNQLISSQRMIPYSRPKLSDLYTLSQSKLLENHTLHSGTYLYIPYMAVPPPPWVDSGTPGKVQICTFVSHFDMF